MDFLEPRAQQTELDGHEVVVLTDPSTSSRVVIATTLGCNIISFDTQIDRSPVAVIASPPSMEHLKAQPSKWGIPILFPYPGQIEKQQFQFRDRTIRITGLGGKALHGFVRLLPWELVSASATDATGASLLAKFDSRTSGISPAHWPFEFVIMLTVCLRQRSIRVLTEVTNTGTDSMPFGLGFHPYFPLPFGSNGHFDDCKVYVAASEHLEQTSSAIPSGQVTTMPKRLLNERPRIGDILPNMTSTSGPIRNYLFRQSRHRRRHGVRSGIYDPLNRLSVSLSGSSDFSTLVLFTPAERPLLCLEPLTCVPNGLNSVDIGGMSPGILQLAPSQSWRGWFGLSVQSWIPCTTPSEYFLASE